METDQGDQSDLDPGPFENRYLIEIERWNWNLHVGLSAASTPMEHRFQGGLNYVRGFELTCGVLAPKAHAAKTLRVWLSPFGPDIQFGADALDDVGQLHHHADRRRGHDFSATLLLPESALPMTATCLGSIWKYLHVWVFDEADDHASISAYSFSSTVHKSLEPWVALG